MTCLDDAASTRAPNARRSATASGLLASIEWCSAVAGRRRSRRRRPGEERGERREVAALGREHERRSPSSRVDDRALGEEERDGPLPLRRRGVEACGRSRPRAPAKPRPSAARGRRRSGRTSPRRRAVSPPRFVRSRARPRRSSDDPRQRLVASGAARSPPCLRRRRRRARGARRSPPDRSRPRRERRPVRGSRAVTSAFVSRRLRTTSTRLRIAPNRL